MAPVMRDPPLCTLAQLSDGTYTLDDLEDFHEAMAEQAEYHRRMSAAADRASKARKPGRP